MVEKQANKGDVIVIQPDERGVPAFMWRFTKFDGKRWEEYTPKSDEEWEALVTGRMSKSTKIIIND